MVVNGDDYIAPEGWEELSAGVLEGAPFKLWANNFKSRSERLRAFVDDPRKFLTGGQFDENYGDIMGEAIPGVDDDTRISTWITNHHNTLKYACRRRPQVSPQIGRAHV